MLKTNEENIRQLLSRGVEDIVDRKHLGSALLSDKKLRVKLGFDPTGAKIHIGRAIVLRKLREFQELGHKVIFIVGNFTAQVGDPSDKLEKRPMLSPAQIEKNLKDYQLQVGKIIDLSKAEFRYNAEWLAKLNFQEIAELAESFSLQQMSARRNFKQRIERGEDVSLREMLYPLMQGYDSVMVKADVEIGGLDQLFNLKAGRVVQRHYGQTEQDIMTCQMLEGTDGRKMSTSWGNVINMTDKPDDMFGKVMSVRDELIAKYFLLCTDVPEKDISEMESRMKKGKLNPVRNGVSNGVNPRDAKMRLAREIVAIYHGKKMASDAEEKWSALFSKKETTGDLPPLVIRGKRMSVLEVVVLSGIFKSKSEARRLIEQNGFRVDGTAKNDPNEKLSLRGGEVLKVGKRHFFRAISA